MMTKQPSEKRKIVVEDKRGREEPPATVDDSLLRQFSDAAATAGPAPANQCEDAVKQSADTVATEWEQKAGEYLDLAQRKEAELRNFRKRVEQDLEEARRYAAENLLADLFPALDGLAQAARTYKDAPDGENPLLDGVRSTVKTLERALLKHGIEKIDAAGVPFDAELHQPLQVETSADVQVETVAEVYVQGYKLGDMVLKPAMVRVVQPE
jgi:molecular chaperone GrpE